MLAVWPSRIARSEFGTVISTSKVRVVGSAERLRKVTWPLTVSPVARSARASAPRVTRATSVSGT